MRWTSGPPVMRWWMLPSNGSVHGPGGRLRLFGFVDSRDDLSLEERKTMRSTATATASNTLSSIVVVGLWLADRVAFTTEKTEVCRAVAPVVALCV